MFIPPRRTLALSAALLFTAALSACGSDDRHYELTSGEQEVDPGVCAHFTSTFTIRNNADQEADAFDPGEAVRFELRITNNSTSEQTLAQPPVCDEIFAVSDAAQQRVWSDNEGKVCAKAATSFHTYAPGESQTLTVSWPQTYNGSGEPVPSGRYTGTARYQAQCMDRFNHASDFTIR